MALIQNRFLGILVIVLLNNKNCEKGQKYEKYNSVTYKIIFEYYWFIYFSFTRTLNVSLLSYKLSLNYCCEYCLIRFIPKALQIEPYRMQRVSQIILNTAEVTCDFR